MNSGRPLSHTLPGCLGRRLALKVRAFELLEHNRVAPLPRLTGQTFAHSEAARLAQRTKKWRVAIPAAAEFKHSAITAGDPHFNDANESFHDSSSPLSKGEEQNLRQFTLRYHFD